MLSTCKKWLYNNNILSFIAFFQNYKSQVNLIIDPSFEFRDSCIANMQTLGVKTWHCLDSINNTYQATSACTPQYFNICSPYNYGSLPINQSTGTNYQYPRTGDGMYGVEFFLLPSQNALYNRDYLRGRIRGGLINGQQYCGKFYVNLFNTQYYGVDRFCAYLDNGALDANNECLPIVVTPTWENPSFNYITDTLGWQLVQGAFTANGTETYITIGNFYSHANTNKIVFNAASTRYGEAYYYVDDVSIIATTIKAKAGNDTLVCLGDSINLGRPNEVGLECNWYVAGNATPFANTSNIWYKPTTTGTITLVQSMDNCMMSYDTVKVVVCNSTGVKEMSYELGEMSLVPNPTSGMLNVELKMLNEKNVTIQLLNSLGQILLSENSNTKTHQLKLSDFAKGIYFVRVSYSNGMSITKKIVKE